MDDLDLLVGFLNTLDVEEGTDELGEPAAAERWFAGHGLLEATTLDPQDLGLARELRQALSELATAHHDQRPDPSAAARFADVARMLPLQAAADDAGRVRLEPAGQGVAAALGRIVVAVARAAATGTWERVKVCPADDCRWAFIDRSKNRSRRWCAMGVCGNRQKTRAYRERQSGG